MDDPDDVFRKAT